MCGFLHIGAAKTGSNMYDNDRPFKFTFHVTMYKYLREDNEVTVLWDLCFYFYHFRLACCYQLDNNKSSW